MADSRNNKLKYTVVMFIHLSIIEYMERVNGMNDTCRMDGAMIDTHSCSVEIFKSLFGVFEVN